MVAGKLCAGGKPLTAQESFGKRKTGQLYAPLCGCRIKPIDLSGKPFVGIPDFLSLYLDLLKQRRREVPFCRVGQYRDNGFALAELLCKL